METKKLSILICSLESRKQFLKSLLDELEPQLMKDVEVLISVDKGETIIGRKRNCLLRDSKGQFCAFIDDDDSIASTYIKDILVGIETGVDCIGIEGIITVDGKNPKKFIHSLKYDKWFEDIHAYYRNPNHLNPIKREIAVKVQFPELNHGEDHVFSKNVYPLLKTEYYIDHPIYFYKYRSVK